MERYWIENGILASNECGGLVKYADAQRALDALQAQLRQVEGQSQQQAEEAVIVFAKYTTLRQLVEALCSASERLLEDVIGASDAADTLKRRTKQVRATLAARDAGKADVSYD